MTQIYVSDSAAHMSVASNRVIVRSDTGDEQEIPIDTVDGISIFGRTSMTMPLIIEMLKREIDIQLYTTDGHYQGRISTPNTTYAPRLRAQVYRSDDNDFSLAIAKRIIVTKIRNQIALVKAHEKEASGALSIPLKTMEHSLKWVNSVSTIAEASGHEGNAAKGYFAALAQIVPEPFSFSGRSTRPPKDAFNSMISLGYSLMYRNVLGAIERNGLNPYIGFLHQDSRNHATLASDIMEMWRAPIVDDAVLCLLAEERVSTDMFTSNNGTGAVYGTWEATRFITKAFSNRIARPASYLDGDTQRYTFQYALDLQLQSLVRAIEQDNPSLYADITFTDESTGI